ncbi:MAG: hypothetical protein IH596_14465 [Bacteroidales bacterium]|nr:hypothetical protein [Bacteroidales bacterium]
MNKISSYIHQALLFLLLILLTPGCRQHTASSPPEFEAYKNNPILTTGTPGSWDDFVVCAPQIILSDSVFYLFYMGYNKAGRMAVGLATSNDGIHFEKFPGNPVLASDNTGFDAFSLGPGIILKEDSTWVMFYNCQELAGYTPGATVGRATAKQLTGPWIRGSSPVITSGKKGEWDDGFTIPSSVLKLSEGNYRMYYSGGREIALADDFYIGMATSVDGITWKKYNDPATSKSPFLDSDPVLMEGNQGKWDCSYVWMANVKKSSEGYRMYYTGVNGNKTGIGYAESTDGIQWQRNTDNPIYQEHDNALTSRMNDGVNVENPSVLFLDTICFMYFDASKRSTIGLATSPLH